MPLFLEARGAVPVGARRVGLVERKGLGHPDFRDELIRGEHAVC